VDAKNFGAALTLITKASDLAGNGEVFDRKAMQELKAYVNDSFAYFYYRRGKYEAALHYAQKAMQVLLLLGCEDRATSVALLVLLPSSFSSKFLISFTPSQPPPLHQSSFANHLDMQLYTTLGAREHGGLGARGESTLA